jgi:hypothetical protein
VLEAFEADVVVGIRACRFLIHSDHHAELQSPEKTREIQYKFLVGEAGWLL